MKTSLDNLSTIFRGLQIGERFWATRYFSLTLLETEPYLSKQEKLGIGSIQMQSIISISVASFIPTRINHYHDTKSGGFANTETNSHEALGNMCSRRYENRYGNEPAFTRFGAHEPKQRA